MVLQGKQQYFELLVEGSGLAKIPFLSRGQPNLSCLREREEDRMHFFRID